MQLRPLLQLLTVLGGLDGVVSARRDAVATKEEAIALLLEQPWEPVDRALRALGRRAARRGPVPVEPIAESPRLSPPAPPDPFEPEPEDAAAALELELERVHEENAALKAQLEERELEREERREER